MLGEHSHEVLRDYGFADDEIAALESERVIAIAEATADV
jgi:crotonobetainyl-CoA:carnitine CoA-transferase CaiB-like acyl-CoA transferase